MEENDLAWRTIGEAIDIHKKVGPGLLEKVYEECLYYRLRKAGFMVAKEVPIPVFFEDVQMECGYRADLIVENRLIIEVKCIESLSDIHVAQVLTYLRFAGCKLGLIMNFNERILKNGIKRVVLNL